MPVIDGVIGADEWKEAQYFDGFFDQPNGGKMVDRTEAWVGVSLEGIYVAIYAHDSQPDEIVTRVFQRGSDVGSDDFAGLIIDPLNRRAISGNSQFWVTAAGTQQERIAGGSVSKKEWRGSWSSKTSRVADGYVVEMMVPWRLLQYPAGRTANILVNVGRVQQRTKTTAYAVDMGRPFRVENHGVMTGVSFPKRSMSERLDLLGYVSPEYDEDQSTELSLRAGFDVRFRQTDTLTTVLSVNPDFKNIEGQVEGIGFTRSERFLQDTRPFFIEGGQYFDLTSQYGFGRLFYSNRVDDFDQGIKFFGDFDRRQSIGFFASREDANRLDSVFRYGYRFSPRSGASVFGTYRDEPKRKNSVMGMTGYWGSGQYSSSVELAQSDDAGQPGMAGSIDLDYEVPNYFATAKWYVVQPEFRARLGFVPFVDRRGAYFYNEYTRQFREGAIRSVQFDGGLDDFDHLDGRNFQRGNSLGASIETRSDWRLGVDYSRDTFEDEVTETYGVNAGWNVSNRYRQLFASFNFGDQGGQYSSFLSFSGQFRIADGLDLGFSQSAFRLAGSREQTVVGLGWEIDEEQSLTGRFVRTDEDSNWYVAYRKAGGLGLEYFLIFGDPNAREFRNRAAIKVIWAR